jgi:serine phosphatase RsbU (regulator of sigma subunit)/CHASE3 domain sensor protein
VRLRLRVLLLTGAFLALFAGNAIFVWEAIDDRDRALAELAPLQSVHEGAALVLTGIVDQQSALRAYVTTNAASYLRDYESGRAETARRISTLTQAVDGRPALQLGALRLQDAHDRWSDSAAEWEITFMREGQVDAARAHVGSRRARAMYGEVRSALLALQGEVAEAREAAEARLIDARRRLSVIVYSSMAIGTALSISLLFLLRAWVLVPLRRLSRSVREVAAGDHGRHITLDGPPELASLAADAELMRRTIVTKLEEVERSRQALEQHGPTVLSLRTHLEPSDAPLPSRLAVGVRSRPAQGVLAGDWYDLFMLDERNVAMCLVDVAGHGPEAGVLALRAKQLLLAGLRDGKDPSETLTWTAHQLGDTGELFLTAIILLLDVRTGVCRYANAGHPPGYVVGGGRREELAPTGPLLGPLDANWSTRMLELDLDAMIVACTDGVLEARNAEGEEFGADRLLHTVRAFHLEGPHAVAAQCLEAAHAFAGAELHDDLTIVALALTPRRIHLPETPSQAPASEAAGRGRRA